MGHELRNSSVTLLQADGFIFTAWATALGSSGRSLLYLMLLIWNGDLGGQLKPLWLLLGPVGTVGGCHLLCSQDGGSGLEVTRQLEQHSQSSLACFSSTYLWINFGFIWIIHLCFFDSQLKFVLCYLVFLQLGSLFLWRCVFPIELFYLTWGITTAYHSCVLAAVGFSNVAFGVLKC